MSPASVKLILHLPLWALAILAFILVFIVIWFFAREILKQIYEALKIVPGVFGGLFLAVGRFFYQMAEIAWTLWGLLFALRWRAQFAVRSIFFATTAGVLLLSTLYLSAELLMTLIHGLKSELPEFYAQVVSQLSSRLPAAYALLNKFHIRRVPEIPFTWEVGLFVLALLTVRHHWHEFLAGLRREAVPPALEELFLEFDKFRKNNPTPTRAVKDAFLETLMGKLKEVLDKRNGRKVAFSLLEEEEIVDANGNKVKTGFLIVTFLPKGSRLDKGLRLQIGEGGAGKAFQQKVAVYIPSVSHRIGIDLDNEKSVGLTYKKGVDRKKFRSILSVPVLVNSKNDAIAVIAVSSRKRTSFWDADFEIVRLAASIISTLY